MCDYLSALSDHPQSEEAGGSPFVPMLVLIIVIIIGFHGCDVVQEGREKIRFSYSYLRSPSYCQKREVEGVL